MSMTPLASTSLCSGVVCAADAQRGSAGRNFGFRYIFVFCCADEVLNTQGVRGGWARTIMEMKSEEGSAGLAATQIMV